MSFAYPPPKKSLGQHFLTNPQICTKIAKLLNPASADLILEIGPGPGGLTNILQGQPHKLLLLLEKDTYWAHFQNSHKAAGTSVILADALEFPWERLARLGRWKIIGNLPYNIASPLLWDMFSRCHCWQKSVCMLQKEVGQRIAAQPGSRAYGALSAWIQNFAKPRLELTLAPGAFSPPPKVASLVLSFTPVQDEGVTAPDKLKMLLALCFQNRRKQLGGIFRRAQMSRLEYGLEKLGIDPKQRPENLAPGDYRALSLFWGN